MSEQLTGLAPEGAVGYRLVLPTRTPDDVPRLSPPLDANGYQGHYSLRPFQAPYDIRLIDGQTYRVVWIGASGEVIPPKQDGTIPGLHFFLTSSAAAIGVEAESVAHESQSAHTEAETERLTRALATALPALQELLTCLTTLAEKQTTPQKPIAEEDEIGVPPKANPENISTDPTPQAEAPQHWDAHPLSEEERQWVIRCALDEERVTLLFRELLRRTEGFDSHDSPLNSTYVPKAEDVKELAMIDRNFVTALATVDLHKELMRAPRTNPTGDYPQPKHIHSLTDFQKQTVLTAFRSPEQRAHFDYLLSRRDALRFGSTLPTKPKSSGNLSRESRRKLERFFQDTRATALMAALNQQALSATEHPVRSHPVLPPSLLALRDS
jgi:hypothetical protein